MEMDAQTLEFSDEASRLFDRGAKEQEVEARLLERGLDAEKVRLLISRIKEIRIRNQRSRGFMFIAAGAVLLVLSFALTVMHFHTGDSIDLVMYGLTIPGITLIMIGFMNIF